MLKYNCENLQKYYDETNDIYEAERTGVLEQEKILPLERKNIEDLSSNIVKYQNALHVAINKEKEGVNFNGE